MSTPKWRPARGAFTPSEVAHQLRTFLAVDPPIVAVEYPAVLLVGSCSDLGGAASPRGFHGLIVTNTRRDAPEHQGETDRRQDPPDVLDDQPDEEQHADDADQSATGMTLLTAHSHHHLRCFE